jgi:hypothetical protein
VGGGRMLCEEVMVRGGEQGREEMGYLAVQCSVLHPDQPGQRQQHSCLLEGHTVRERVPVQCGGYKCMTRKTQVSKMYGSTQVSSCMGQD